MTHASRAVRFPLALVAALGCGSSTPPASSPTPPAAASPVASSSETPRCDAIADAAPAATPSADDMCTEIGCQNGLVIEPSMPSAWPAGNYRFVLDLDGAAVTCEGSLPLRPCATPSVTCSAGGVQITESGCALPPAEHGFGEIYVTDCASRVGVRIERGGAAIAEATITPTYEADRPNGPSCGPVCVGARASLPVAAATP